MDLIIRKAAIDRLNAIPPGNWSKARYTRELWNVPSVPAVPLDKLCEWLARNAFAFECEDCEEYCKALLDCEHEVGSDQEYWKNKLTKWMEEQDAQTDQPGK